MSSAQKTTGHKVHGSQSASKPIPIGSSAGRQYQRLAEAPKACSAPGLTRFIHDYSAASREGEKSVKEAVVIRSKRTRRAASEIVVISGSSASSSSSSQAAVVKTELESKPSEVLFKASENFADKAVPELIKVLSHRHLRYQLAFWGNRFPACTELARFLSREKDVNAVTVVLQPVVSYNLYRLFQWITEMRYRDHIECIDDLPEVPCTTKMRIKDIAERYWKSPHPEKAGPALRAFTAEVLPLALSKDVGEQLDRAGFGMYCRLFNRQGSEERNAKTIDIITNSTVLICGALDRVFDDMFESRDISRRPARPMGTLSLREYAPGTVGAALYETAQNFQKVTNSYFTELRLSKLISRHNPEMAGDPEALAACRHFISIMAGRGAHVIEHFGTKAFTALLRQNGRCQRDFQRDIISVLFSRVAKTLIRHLELYQDAVTGAASKGVLRSHMYSHLMETLKEERRLHAKVPARTKLNPDWDREYFKHVALPKIRRIIAQNGYVQEGLTAVFPELMADLSKHRGFRAVFKGIDQEIEDSVVEQIVDKMQKILDPPHNNENIIRWVRDWWESRQAGSGASSSSASTFPVDIASDDDDLAKKSLIALQFWFDEYLRAKIPMESVGLADIVWGLFSQLHDLLQYPNFCRNIIFDLIDTALDELCGDRVWDKPEKREFWLKSALPSLAGDKVPFDEEALGALASVILQAGKYGMRNMDTLDSYLKSAGVGTIHKLVSWLPGTTEWGLKKLVIFLVDLIDKDFEGSSPRTIARIVSSIGKWLSSEDGYAKSLSALDAPKEESAAASSSSK